MNKLELTSSEGTDQQVLLLVSVLLVQDPPLNGPNFNCQTLGYCGE